LRKINSFCNSFNVLIPNIPEMWHESCSDKRSFHTEQKKEKRVKEMPLLLLSRFSRVRLCATPQTAAYQAPPSLGISRQEHWSGLPFP